MSARDRFIAHEDEMVAWLTELRKAMRAVVVGGEGEQFAVHDRAEALRHYERANELIFLIQELVKDDSVGGVRR